MTKLDSTKLAVIGSVVILECKVTGSPEIAIKWYKNNIEISPSYKYQMTFTDSVATLQISNCSLEECGDYICVASSDSGSDKCSCLVTVKGMKENHLQYFTSYLSTIALAYFVFSYPRTPCIY